MYVPKRDEAEYQAILQEIREDRERLRNNSSFLVETILPSEEFHIIAGPSGVGKTTWFLPILKDWSEAKPVLGFKSNPTPYVYISCDRSLKALDRTLARIGLEDWDIHAYSIEDLDRYLLRYGVRDQKIDEMGNEHTTQLTHEDLQLEFLPYLFNDAMKLDIKVFVVEAYGWFMESAGNGKGLYRDTMRLGSKIRKAYERYGCSLIVTTHVPKMKKGEGYANPRERIIGSVGQAAVASTIILLEQADDSDVNDPNRIVTICPRDSKALVLNYELNETGGYVMSEVQGSSSKDGKNLHLMNSRLEREKEEVEIGTYIFMRWADEYKISHSAVERWITKKVEKGELKKIRHGAYKKPRAGSNLVLLG